MAIVNSHSVAVSKSEVSCLVPDDTVAVTIAMIVNGYPVRAISTVSNDSLEFVDASTNQPFDEKWVIIPVEELMVIPRMADNQEILPLHQGLQTQICQR